MLIPLLACVALDSEPARFDSLHTTIDLGAEGSALTEIERKDRGPRGQVLAVWSAKLDTAQLSIVLRALDRAQFKNLESPSDIVDLTQWNRANADKAAKKPGVFSFDESRAVPGEFGWVPYAWVGIATHEEGTKPVGTFVNFAVLTPDFGWELEIEAEPALLGARTEELVRSIAAAVVYDGPRMTPEWTDEEVDERWTADAPARVQEDRKLQVVRSDYYLIMTVVGKGTAANFGKRMDENYELIRSIFPFEDVPGQRLLPIYYFQDPSEYHEFLMGKIGWTREQAERSGGVASGDWYATYHQATTAPVHVHEATHQIFRNRLMLPGGGSWFQEGVAEYMSSNANDLNPIERLAKDGDYTPFREFLVVPSLLMSNSGSRITGGSNAGLAYSQAAAIIEFVRHSEGTRDRFLDWLHAVGRTGRGDLAAIERATVATLGYDVDEFEKRWREYYSDRSKVRDWQVPASEMRPGKPKR